MRVVGVSLALVSTAVKDFFRREVLPAPDGEQLPPIRYIGDPKDIYLA